MAEHLFRKFTIGCRIEHHGSASLRCDPCGFHHGGDWNLKLHEEDVAGLKKSAGIADILDREVRIGAGGNHDAVFSIPVHGYQCDSGRSVRSQGCADVDPFFGIVVQGIVSELVPAYLADEGDLSPGSDCRHGLVCALPSRAHCKIASKNGLTRCRQSGSLHGHVRVAAS